MNVDNTTAAETGSPGHDAARELEEMREALNRSNGMDATKTYVNTDHVPYDPGEIAERYDAFTPESVDTARTLLEAEVEDRYQGTLGGENTVPGFAAEPENPVDIFEKTVADTGRAAAYLTDFANDTGEVQALLQDIVNTQSFTVQQHELQDSVNAAYGNPVTPPETSITDLFNGEKITEQYQRWEELDERRRDLARIRPSHHQIRKAKRFDNPERALYLSQQQDKLLAEKDAVEEKMDALTVTDRSDGELLETAYNLHHSINELAAKTGLIELVKPFLPSSPDGS